MKANMLSSVRGCSKLFPYILCFAFFCLGLFAILRHGMWLDELQAWTLARDHVSICNMLSSIKYDGHPSLWYLLLFAITRFTHNPVWMQILHLFIATLSVFVFSKFSPFPKWQKGLFIFGYYPLYKYGIVSRNYSLGVLFIFLLCVMFKDRRKKYISLSLILLLLCHTNVLGLIIAIDFGILLFGERVIDQNSFQSPRDSPKNIFIALLLFLFGIGSSIIQLIPPSDCTQVVNWRFIINIDYIGKFIMNAVSNGYFPLSSQVIQNPSILLFVSCISLLFSSFIFFQAPMVLCFYLLGTVGLLTFFYVKYLGFIHHYGYLFILLIVCLWMFQNGQYRRGNNCSHIKNYFITIILIYHFLCGIVVTFWDGVHPFSASRETALFIKNHQMDHMLMVGDSYVWVSPITGYLNKKIYYPSIDRVGSYVVWNFKRAKVSQDELMNKARGLMFQKQEDVLLILNYKLRNIPGFVKEIQQFTNARNPSERYYLYQMKYNKASPKGAENKRGQ